jgi:hypothetical protein
MPTKPRSPQVLLALKAHTQSLLSSGAYNLLMAVLRQEMAPGLGISRLEKEDFERVLKLMAWMTGFVRCMQVIQ